MWREEQLQQLESSSSSSSMWIFGYGSLIWNPGFDFSESRRAHARGWKRRMYQGNTFHRGDDVMPGRVATLVESSHANTSGVVFRVDGGEAIEKAIRHLSEREVGNGYNFKIVKVSVESDKDGESMHKSILALTCIASTSNEFYLGPAHPTDMAVQIGTARGKAGPNFEYVLKLAEHIRLLFPREEDKHLFGLERRVRDVIKVAA